VLWQPLAFGFDHQHDPAAHVVGVIALSEGRVAALASALAAGSAPLAVAVAPASRVVFDSAVGGAASPAALLCAGAPA
jgi:hypothetical protein